MGFVTDDAMRQALRRLLVTYADYNPSVGYCQSLNFIAAVFLLVADEEGAFWLLVALCRRVVPDYHTHQMTGLRIDTQLFSSMVAQCLPSLDSHFAELQVPTEILASQWWLCMYANILPTSTLLRVWDAVLSGGGFDSLVAASFAILRTHAKELHETEDIADVYAVLGDKTPAMWDADKMMLEMQNAMHALDPSGQRRAELHASRESRRRQLLEKAVAATAFDLADLVALGISPASVLTITQNEPTALVQTKMKDGLVIDAGQASDVRTEPEAVRRSQTSGAERGEPEALLSSACLDLYFKPAQLASLLAGPLSAQIQEKLMAEEGFTVADGGVSEESARKIFQEIDKEGVGVLSLRQILVGLKLREPVPAVGTVLQGARLHRDDSSSQPFQPTQTAAQRSSGQSI